MGILETVKMLEREEGRDEAKREVVTNLIRDFKFTDAQAAKAATVSVYFVRKIRAELKRQQENS